MKNILPHLPADTVERALSSVVMLSTFLAGAAHAQTIEQDGLLRDRDGRTVYVFDRDTQSQSACIEACLAVWPAFLAKEGATERGAHTLHRRADGRLQWGWKGRPLYYYVGDTRVGDAAGDGSGGLWHTLRTAPVTSGYGY